MDSAISSQRTSRLFAAGASSAALSAAAAFLIYVMLEEQPGIVQLAALAAAGVLIGILVGCVAGAGYAKVTGAGAFAGTVVLWTPVVLVTYGFALLYLPLFALYGVLVALASKAGGALRS
ncbi:hypothetical protein ACHMW6_01110 [Pseudoduganella sp. UC29_106]|uniref:hypothetical protein n=1 Tax=Pseudoduganella sp. UC29_106 TaxID=3374553 RepID=UPI0037581C0F